MKQFVILLLLACNFTYAQPPAGYYDGTQGLVGDSLRYKLHDIISNNFTSVSYSSLYTHYQSTDKKPNGKVWDMYSDIPGGTPPYEYNFYQTCGNYTQEGQCYNREHTVPASWFNDAYPMYSDLFMVVPTDGYVNNKRANYPYGKVANVSWTSQNGSKLGSSAVSGYTGTVFEPIDSFKGDFARIYFYVATRYKDEIPSWNSSTVFQGNNLSTWAKNLFIQWHNLDPVSAKEIQRNNAVYQIQKNRNPYIDHPEFVSAVWLETYGIQQNILPEITLYPNPVTTVLNISIANNDTFQIIIYDVYGKIVYHNVCIKQTLINTESYTNGTYILQLQSKNYSVFYKFIKV
ncbi:MAG: endonuclease [Bacteroidales bacterium]|nr:endonuclease [Bacteroidales bacterium]